MHKIYRPALIRLGGRDQGAGRGPATAVSAAGGAASSPQRDTADTPAYDSPPILLAAAARPGVDTQSDAAAMPAVSIALACRAPAPDAPRSGRCFDAAPPADTPVAH